MTTELNLGLTGSVWSSDRKKALAIARRIKAGAVTVNDHLMSHGLAETPWGGFKESGIGRTHGEIGFQGMSEPQVIVEDIMPFVKRNMWWHPHDISVYQGIKGLLEMLYGSDKAIYMEQYTSRSKIETDESVPLSLEKMGNCFL